MGNGGPDDNDAQANRIVAVPLTSGGHPNSNAPGRRKEDDQNLVASTLVKRYGKGTDAGTVRSHVSPGSNASEEIVQEQIVRRLMPVECERLQGFPDGWTELADTADTPRYSGLGDAVTVPVAEWIGGRLSE
jgi:DNA (cytosine-5)-methyltransferase 1